MPSRANLNDPNLDSLFLRCEAIPGRGVEQAVAYVMRFGITEPVAVAEYLGDSLYGRAGMGEPLVHAVMDAGRANDAGAFERAVDAATDAADPLERFIAAAIEEGTRELPNTVEQTNDPDFDLRDSVNRLELLSLAVERHGRDTVLRAVAERLDPIIRGEGGMEFDREYGYEVRWLVNRAPEQGAAFFERLRGLLTDKTLEKISWTSAQHPAPLVDEWLAPLCRKELAARQPQTQERAACRVTLSAADWRSAQTGEPARPPGVNNLPSPNARQSELWVDRTLAAVANELPGVEVARVPEAVLGSGRRDFTRAVSGVMSAERRNAVAKALERISAAVTLVVSQETRVANFRGDQVPVSWVFTAPNERPVFGLARVGDAEKNLGELREILQKEGTRTVRSERVRREIEALEGALTDWHARHPWAEYTLEFDSFDYFGETPGKVETNRTNATREAVAEAVDWTDRVRAKLHARFPGVRVVAQGNSGLDENGGFSRAVSGPDEGKCAQIAAFAAAADMEAVLEQGNHDPDQNPRRPRRLLQGREAAEPIHPAPFSDAGAAAENVPEPVVHFHGRESYLRCEDAMLVLRDRVTGETVTRVDHPDFRADPCLPAEQAIVRGTGQWTGLPAALARAGVARLAGGAQMDTGRVPLNETMVLVPERLQQSWTAGRIGILSAEAARPVPASLEADVPEPEEAEAGIAMNH